MTMHALDANAILNVAGRGVCQPTHEPTASRAEALSRLLARQRAAFLRNGPPVADATGVHAERTFTLPPTPDGSSTVVVSHETQVGVLPWVGRAFLAPRLHAVNKRCSTT